MADLENGFRCLCVLLCVGLSLCFTNSLDVDFKPKTTKVVSLHIKSSILYRFSSTSVTSTIINDDVRATETTFEVTLPDAAFISNFTLEIDGNIYPGEVKEKDIAKNTYENARWAGQSAGHIETRPRDTNKFKISINIAAFSEVTFVLSYNELLQRRRGNYDHTIYVNPGQIVDSLLIEVMIQESRAITQLHVPPLRNDILTERQNSIWNSYATVRRPSLTSAYIRYNPSPEDQKRASLKGMAGLFVVEYDVERTTNIGEILVVNGYFVHYFAPQGIPRMKRKILFILDSSGSMIGTKINQVKTAMSEILSNLDKGDKFNIIQFAGDVTKWWNHTALVEVNQFSISAARNFINDIKADGWTNINDALSEGLELIQEDDDNGFASLVIFLTDGAATEGETDQSKILDNISSENKKNIPIFSLSFGEDADYGFLKKMSAQNDGFVRKIYEASDASLQLTGFYGEIASTLLSNLTFQYIDDTIVGKSITNTIYPSFFEGSEIVIAGHISELNVSAMNLEVCGTSSKGPLEWRTTTGNNIFDLIQDAPSESIASNFSDITEKIWAYMTIKQVLIHRLRERNSTARIELKRKALDLALKYKFVTPLTSMVVTRPQDENVIQPSADYGLNDSPHSVWGSALTGNKGLALAGNSPTFVDSDPHFIVRVKGLKDSVCFDVMGNSGDVYNLVKDEISGIIVNAEVVTTGHGKDRNSTLIKHQNGTRNKASAVKTYFGEISISGDRSVINVSPSRWKVNGHIYNWQPAQTITVHKTKLVTDGTGKMIAIMFPHKITLLIVRHMRTMKQLDMGQIHFLGFYIVDDRGFSWYTHGLLGQFIYRRISLEKKKRSKNGKTRGKLKVEGNTKRMRRVSALLGRRVNLATNSYVSCWMVQKNGRRLIDGVFTDYLVRNSTVSQKRKRKRSKT